MYRELGFALKNTDQNSKAEEIYKIGIKLTDDEFQKSEMAINMAQSYYLIRNQKKFDEWAKITRKYTEKGSKFDKFLDEWKENFKE